MGGCCCCCSPSAAEDENSELARRALHERQEDELERAESFRTNPCLESLDSQHTLVPDRRSFDTLVPERQSFQTLLPDDADARSFRTLPAADSFSAQSHGSYRTLVPDGRSFQTLQGTGSRCGSFDQSSYLPPAKKGADMGLYKDSMEPHAQAQQAHGRMHMGTAKVAPRHGR